MPNQLRNLFCPLLPACFLLLVNLPFHCFSQTQAKDGFTEKQLTFDPQGHFLNHRQAISPSDRWVVFDRRNANTNLGENGVIALLDLSTGQQLKVYETPNQTEFGPGVGAAIYHPQREEVTFIHGLLKADQANPYYITRRSGIALDLSQKDHPTLFALEARDVNPPFTPGALRGGTHAHSYSGDGEWISFTYNDQVMEKASLENPVFRDLRTVGFMMPSKPVQILGIESAEEFSGSKFTLLAASVTPNPRPGSNEIQKAYEEVWLGNAGYINSKGEKVKHALAYLGDLKTKDGKVVTEIFISELPNVPDVLLQAKNLEGTLQSLPKVPESIAQKRLTYTENRKFPGIQGRRQWLRSSSDGSRVYTFMKDDQGVVQIMEVSTQSGEFRQVTYNSFNPDSQFSISPDECYVVYGAKNQLYLTELKSGTTKKIGDEPKPEWSDLGNINWAHSGQFLIYNRTVKSPEGSFLQLFRLHLKRELSF